MQSITCKDSAADLPFMCCKTLYWLVLGHGKQDPQYSERDLFRQDEGHSQRTAIHDPSVGAQAAAQLCG